MYAITGASGQLGRLVIQTLLETIEPHRIVAAVRDPSKAVDLAALGVQVRLADYERPDTLKSAFEGVTRLLLISSNQVDGRLVLHRSVVGAAKAQQVELFAYTSMLHADRSQAKLAAEHRATEAVIIDAALPAVMLRNGWYTENYLLALQPALAHGAMMGAARDGRVSLAARADYASAAAKVLISDGQAEQTYELAGDEGWTLEQFAAEISREAGREVAYRDMPESEYVFALINAGTRPDPVRPGSVGFLRTSDATGPAVPHTTCTT